MLTKDNVLFLVRIKCNAIGETKHCIEDAEDEHLLVDQLVNAALPVYQ